MFKYKLFNKPRDIKINKAVLDDIFGITSELVKIPQNGILNIIFEDDKIIKSLNKEYRKIDSTTDVLSFHYFDDFSWIKKTVVAWEIILSSTKIYLQAKEYIHTNEEEFYKLIIHSILHILGFDHEKESDYKKMSNHENKIIEKIEKIHNIKIN